MQWTLFFNQLTLPLEAVVLLTEERNRLALHTLHIAVDVYSPEHTLQHGICCQNHIVLLQVLDVLGPGTPMENVDFEAFRMLVDLITPLHDGDSRTLDGTT